jgi:hypothetical protein
LIQKRIATDTVEAPITSFVGPAGEPAEAEDEGANMKNVRFAVVMGVSCSAILVLVRIGTAVAMPGLGL